MSERKRIIIQVYGIGNLELAPVKFGITSMIHKPEINDKDFFLWLLRYHLIEPEELENDDNHISVETLNDIFYQWAEKSDIQLALESGKSLESLRHDIEVHISDLLENAIKPMQGAFDTIHDQIFKIVNVIPEYNNDFPAMGFDFLESFPAIRDLTAPAMSLIDFDVSSRISSITGNIFSNIPNMPEIFDETISKLLEESQKSHDALGESEYGFAIDFIIQLCSLEVVGIFRSAHHLSNDEILNDSPYALAMIMEF